MARARLVSALVSFGLFAGLQAVTATSAVAAPIPVVEPAAVPTAADPIMPAPPPVPPTPVVGPGVVDPVAPVTGPGTRPVVEPPSFDDADADVDIDIGPAGGLRRVGGSPLSLGRVKAGRVPEDRLVEPVADPPSRVRFTNVRGEALANAGNVGAEGFVFQVARADGLKTAGRVLAEVDLSVWVDRYGLDWLYRAQIIRMPACALVTPEVEGCRIVEVMPGVLDVKARTLQAELDADPSGVRAAAGRSLLPQRLGDTGWAYAVSAGIVGSGGNWGASTTWTKGSWSTSGSTGAFNWSWPINVPPGVAGPTPNLSVAYSSAAIDGIGGATGSGQGDDFSPGWSLEGVGYIERRYKTCADISGFTAPDLCWAGDNATISFGGRASELIALSPGSNEYRLKDDPGWRVVKYTGGPGGQSTASTGWSHPVVGNGLVDNDGEYWIVYTPDGRRILARTRTSTRGR